MISEKTIPISTDLQNPTILFLREQFTHMGKHSGYDFLMEQLNKKEGVENIWTIREAKQNIIHRIIKKFSPQIFKQSTPYYSYQSYLDEDLVLKKAIENKINIIHLAYLENAYWKLGQSTTKKQLESIKVIATTHQPPKWWAKNATPSLVSSLDALIVLSKASKKYFESYLPNKVFFIPHGVDIHFFKPNSKIKKYQNRCLFVGDWLRDFQLLADIIRHVEKLQKDIIFDIVYPSDKLSTNNIIQSLKKVNNVHFHTNISDTQLSTLYQEVDLLLLPLLDCTANNALLEGMASGLPIITSDIEGVKSYTDSSFTKYIDKANINHTAIEIVELLNNKQEVLSMSNNARSFAETNFAWEIISEKVFNLYQQILQSN